MILCGEEIVIKKKPFEILKKNVCDNAKDVRDMIKRVDDFEDGLEYSLRMNNLPQPNAIKNNPQRSLFTNETIMAAKSFKEIRQDTEEEHEL